MLPKVSIVTPSLNQAAYLEKTILSVLKQDYPNIEFIIVDGGSTDGSLDIIKKFQDRLAYWVSEPDAGQSQAINKGFARAAGEIFNWLNADDLLMPSAVKIAVHYLMQKPDVGVVYGDRITIDEKGNFLRLTQVPAYCARAIQHHLRIPQETVFVRRRCWFEVKGLDEKINFCMDYDLFLKLSKVTQFYHIPFVLGAYRRHPLSKTVLYSRVHKKKAAEEIDRVYFQNFSQNRSNFMKKFYKKFNSMRLFFETMSRSRKREVKDIMHLIEVGGMDSPSYNRLTVDR
jgi:glycosyltransferase involved in cell wall biosynthesis